MRLLRVEGDGRLSCTKDYVSDEEIPPYAILSHTWKEGQEMIFDDLKYLDSMEDIVAQHHEGYRKIRFCAQQAKRNSLQYFWVDTCCIDKSNNTELSEAINSMFRWYQKAERCYVYLSDVEANASDKDSELSQKWKPAFRKSRWFTRGWTLQELLAPKLVEFFSVEGKRLGDRESLKQTIHEITEIPVEALSGSSLFKFSVAERLSWTANRETTRKEDGAYCLLGIFGTHLPLIYGEGKEKALKRLRREIQESREDELSAAVVKNNNSRSRDQEARLGKIREWLAAPDPSTNYHKALKQRQADTGLWLLEGEKFIRWKTGAMSRLWLYGIPGCGKTVLSSTVVENLLQHCHDDLGTVTVYFYFDFNDAQKQDAELMVRSLLCQLLQQLTTIPRSLDTLFSSCQNEQRQPSLQALLEVLQQTMQDFTQIYIVLDALDECTQRSELMDVLATVAGWQLQNLHLLMTSRKERDIESSLEDYVDSEDTVCLQSDVVDGDIQRYVQQRLSSDKSLTKWEKDAAVRQEIEVTLMRGAHGMFRWAACQLDALGKCRSRTMLRKALATLPPTLEQTYDRILCAISEEDSKYALRILQWLTFSARPLSPEEVAEAVAIDVTRDPAFDRDDIIEDPLEVLDICSSLVTLTAENERGTSRSSQRIIALAHYSVQEYLVSDRIRRGQAKSYSMQDVVCHDAIAKASLQYLMQFQQPLSQEVLNMSALARYSAEFWSSHLQKTGDRELGTSLLAIKLLSTENPAYLTWIRLCDPDKAWRLNTITKLLLNNGADVNAQGGLYGNALQAASFGGHKETVRLLLNKGAEINAQGGQHGNAFHAASCQGHNEIMVALLLNRGAEINAQGGYWGNALQAASSGGHKEIVTLLLDRGAEINAQGGDHGNALQAASFKGHKEIVRLLLD
ncbi:hypothetical protein BU25DRAFT_371926, partial [Macroventuria anomochaeta]